MSSLREELQRIYEDEGTLTAKVVVDSARPDDAPLHSRFEWNDTVAGERFREVQAMELIRSVTITFQPPAATTHTQVRVFHHVTTADSGPHYVPLSELAGDEFLSRQALANAQREWRNLYAKYEGLDGWLESVRRDVA